MQEFAPHFERAGKILIVGLGLSGRAALRLCALADRKLHLYDRHGWRGEDSPDWPLFEGEEIPTQAFEGVGTVLLSPGVDPRPIREKAAKLGLDLQFQGEMGLALRCAQRLWPQLKTVLITGTNGKSTVTDLCAHLLAQAGRQVFAGGNLGIPLSELLVQVAQGEAPRPELLVLECSSYQLETLEGVRAQVAMLLNVSPDHLDRYRDIEHYAATKAKIFDTLQGEDLALLDAQDPRTPALSPAHASTIWVGQADGPRWVESPESQGQLWLDAEHQIARSRLSLPGRHNASNAIFALLAAHHLGVDYERGALALESYRGLEHRMQLVDEIDEVLYFNDSKATNVASVLAGLDGFPRPYILICGGQAKQGDRPEELMALMQGQCQALIGIGEAGDQLVRLAKQSGIVAYREARLQAAVPLARSLAKPGQAVLLSPACASWDQFKSYAARGECFVQSVRELRAESRQ